MKPTGFLVMESCDDYEQALTLLTHDTLPTGGILDWADRTGSRAMFSNRADAKKAIDRTEHYRLAYGRTDLPEKSLCRVVPIVAVPNVEVTGSPALSASPRGARGARG